MSMTKLAANIQALKQYGLSFNPSGDDAVSDCKTEMQTAQMWAVKALTWKD